MVNNSFPLSRFKISIDLIVLAVSGAVLGFAFSPFPFRFLAWVSLVWLFAVIEKYKPKQVLGLGLWFGFFASLSIFWWLFLLLVPLAGWVKGLMYVGVIILCVYLGLFTALFAWATRRLGLWVAPFIWAIVEFMRTKTQLAFPWGLLGYSQTPYVPFIQFASLTGVYGVSAWVVLINLLVYLTIKNYKKYLPGLVAAFAIPFLFGILTIKKNRDWFRVSIIQPNVGPNDKVERFRDSLFTDLVGLARTALQYRPVGEEATGGRPDLLVFPETATLANIVRNQSYQRILTSLVDGSQTALITGTPLYEYTPAFSYFNGAVLFLPDQGIVGEYKKMKLVPFSEKIPYSDNLKFLKKVDFAGAGGDFCFGRNFTVFSLPEGHCSVLICYEAIFPDLTREFTRRGAQFLVGISNDGWFGRTPAPYQHCEMAVMRTVENGVPLVRSANIGISLIADPYGRVLKKSGLFTKEIITGMVPRPKQFTFYRKFGDVFIVLSTVIVLLAIGLKIGRVKKKS